MKFYYYDIVNNKVDDFNGEVSGVGPDFKQYEKSFGVHEIYYKVSGGKISEIICEAFSQQESEKGVSDFLNSHTLSAA